MYIRLVNLFNQIRASLWLVPALMSISAFLLAQLASYLDKLYAGPMGRRWPEWLIYQGDVEGVRTLLSTVAGSTITVAGVTFSVTVVALSMASSQFGPRLLLSFMRDTGNQVVLGTLVSTFLYCLLALGNGHGDAGVVPAASASIGLALAIVSVWVFIYFMHHVSSSMRAEYVVDVVARDVTAAIERLMLKGAAVNTKRQNGSADWRPADAGVVCAEHSGYLQAVDEAGLIALARDWNTAMKLVYRPGHFINAGEPVILVQDGQHREALRTCVNDYLIIGRVRTDEQDPEYGIHQLVEVASRALSPGINDPHTAMSCIDWLGSALQVAAAEPLAEAQRYDEEGNLRLICNPITFDGLLHSAFDEIRQNAYAIPAVSIRLMEVLGELAQAVNDPQRKQALEQQANALLQGSLETGMQPMDARDLKQRFEVFAE